MHDLKTPIRKAETDVAAPHAGETFSEERERFITQILTRSLKGLIFVAAPSTIALSLFVALSLHAWQSWTILVGICFAEAGWFISWKHIKRGRINAAAYTSTLTTMTFITVVMCVFDGLAPIGVISTFGNVVLIATVSRRSLYVAAIGCFLSFSISELFRYTFPSVPITLPPVPLLALRLGLFCMLVPLTAFYLRRNQHISELLISSQRATVERQKRIITAIEAVGPIIAHAVAHLRKIASIFATQTNQQAASTSEISTAITEVERLAAQNAGSAISSLEGVTELRQELIESTRALTATSDRLAKAVTEIDSGRAEVNTLISRVGDIETILSANREIGNQIKILSINAGIEAAKAGEYGAGFQVVASELRDLIQRTEENLKRSSELLDQIRFQSRETSTAIQLGSEGLNAQFAELTRAGSMIERSAAEFETSSKIIEQIATAAREQKVGMNEIGSAMTAIDQAASELTGSSKELLEIVEKLMGTQRELRETLEG